MQDYLDPRWRQILAHNGLDGFDALWALDIGWFEEPNRRRGGWSGVSRHELALPEGGTQAIFIKRQENHPTFSWRHPVRGVPTFEREFSRIMRYRACGIPTPTPVLYAARRGPEGLRAILITEALTGFVSLEARVAQWLAEGVPPLAERRRYIEAVAGLLRSIHAHRLQHNCFFPKHIFTRVLADGSVDVRIIDLEKSRWQPSRTVCALRDLYSLMLESQCWRLSDRLRFLMAYLGIRRLTPYAKKLWRRILERAVGKRRLSADAAGRCLVSR